MKKTKLGEYESVQEQGQLNGTAPGNQKMKDCEEIFNKTLKEFDDFLEIPIHLNVLVGKQMVRIGELLDLAPGSLLDLKRPAGESLLIYLENTFFAKGEATVMEDTFTIRITEINDPRKV